MLRPLGVAAVAGVCTIGLVATPAYAGKKHGPAEYKPVRANAAGTYTFTEQKAYDTGGSETVTYTVDFSCSPQWPRRVAGLELDGVRLPSLDEVPLVDDGGEHHVLVTLEPTT